MYEGAFRVGRGAQSLTGDVVVCSGANSMFLRRHIMTHMEEFMKDTFMGKPVLIGDDRKLTEIMLKLGGKVVYQSTAICLTDVPTTLSKFFKQQVRWNKSFFIGSITTLAFAWRRPMLMLWVLGETLLWFVFVIAGAATLLSDIRSLGLILFIYISGYLILSSLSTNVYYMFKNPFYFLLSPIFGLIRMVLIFPIRLWALCTLTRIKWGTR